MAWGTAVGKCGLRLVGCGALVLGHAGLGRVVAAGRASVPRVGRSRLARWMFGPCWSAWG